jgi:hypothetical protein
MNEKASSERGFSKLLSTLFLAIAAILVAIAIFFSPLPRFIRESFMQRATSAHYEILCPRDSLSQDAMEDFARARETSFAAMNKKIGDTASDVKIRIVFDNEFFRDWPGDRGPGTLYWVSRRTIHATFRGKIPDLPLAADAEAILNSVWGRSEDRQIVWWTTAWLAGDWRGQDIGMAAAQLEQKLGHKRLAIVLSDPADNKIESVKDQDLLGAAWISEVAEFGGADAVHKLYAAKMEYPNIALAAQVLGTTPLELDRKWQLWMYSYLAGMPPMPSGSGMQMKMPMDMPMAGSH